MITDPLAPHESPDLNQTTYTSPEDSSAAHIQTNLGIEIRGIGIPPRPSILDKIDREMRRDEPNFRALGEFISADVGLSASLLKIVNSPLYGFNRQVRSVHEALMVLGIKAVAHTVAGLSLKKSFAHLPQMERFWDSSACTARVSGWIAQTLGGMCGVRSEEAYTFGLFRDCGVPVLMTPFPDYPEVLKKANEEETLLFTDIEDEMIGMNHAIVGAAMAKEWLFPDELIQAIHFHHDTTVMNDSSKANRVPEVSRRFIAIAQVAEYLIQVRTGKNTTHEWTKLGAASREILNISDEELQELHDLSEPAVLLHE
ncbi:MAG: hypothetical protein RIR18_81 [Pseudomonadota bacterium]|jgi:HD-like signal output (HDOD) protein